MVRVKVRVKVGLGLGLRFGGRVTVDPSLPMGRKGLRRCVMRGESLYSLSPSGGGDGSGRGLRWRRV